MIVTNDVKYIGVNDTKIDLFEGQYRVPAGMSYNSYLILDERVAVMDTVDAAYGDEWLGNLSRELCGRAPDYLVVLHMEPDHSANILNFLNAYPQAKVVSSQKAFNMMRGFFGTDFAERRIVVAEGDTLNLGKHELVFVSAPMVHWPEVTVAYDKADKILFSADGFGTFGTWDTDEEWGHEARRYYIGVVGGYGAQEQSLRKKASSLDIAMICPLHGPVLKENLSYYINLYDVWSSYKPEENGIVIAYTSVYGNTRRAVEILKESLILNGAENVKLYDLARSDMSEVVAEAFRYSKLVLATTTYNGDVFPHMREFIHHLTERGFSSRTVAFIENGSWAPMATKVMKGMLEKSKNLTYASCEVKINSALNDESLAKLYELCDELCSDFIKNN